MDWTQTLRGFKQIQTFNANYSVRGSPVHFKEMNEASHQDKQITLGCGEKATNLPKDLLALKNQEHREEGQAGRHGRSFRYASGKVRLGLKCFHWIWQQGSH